MTGRRRAHRPAEWTRSRPIGRSCARPAGRCGAARARLRLGLWSDATGCRRWDWGSPPSSRSGSGGSRPSRARRPLAAAALALMAAALLWRRRAPLPALGAMCAIYAAWVLVDPPAGSLMPFVILLVGVFAVAQRETPRRALAGGVAGLAAVWLEIAVTDNDFANYAFTGCLRGRRVDGGPRLPHPGRARRRAVARGDRRGARPDRARAARRGRPQRQRDRDPVAGGAAVDRARKRRGPRAALDRGDRPRGADRDAPAARAAAPRGRGGRARAAAEPAAPRPPRRERARGGPAGRGRDRGRAGRAAARRRPLRLPDRAGGAHQRAQARRSRPARGSLVSYGAGELELRISDDGAGAAAANGGGHGLVGMRERASVYGGVVESGSRPGGGFEIRVRLPL